jgi:hypothetical protein
LSKDSRREARANDSVLGVRIGTLLHNKQYSSSLVLLMLRCRDHTRMWRASCCCHLETVQCFSAFRPLLECQIRGHRNAQIGVRIWVVQRSRETRVVLEQYQSSFLRLCPLSCPLYKLTMVSVRDGEDMQEPSGILPGHTYGWISRCQNVIS